MLTASNYIWVTFQKEGIHAYPAAKDLKGVEFLAHPHRHIFHFRVWLEVFHDDRDVEFILFKRELERIYTENTSDTPAPHGILKMNSKSCEMLARELVEYLSVKYPNRDIAVEVSEDGENGAYVTRDRSSAWFGPR